MVLGLNAVAIVMAMAVNVAACAATPSPPSFQAFAIAAETNPHPFALQITDPQSREFETILRDASQDPANFAGHYILASWGCGASCIMAAAVDTDDGGITWLPFTVCCWRPDAAEPLDFNLRSRLLVVHGGLNETGGGTYYYALNGGKFELVQADERRP